MRIVLVSYFYAPIDNVGAQRWIRYVRYLRTKGHKIEVITGPWQSSAEANGGGSDLKFVADPFSQDARMLTAAPGTATRRPSRLRSLVRSLTPSFLLIDGKWLWSCNVFRELRRSIKRQRPSLVIVTGTPWSSLPAVALACAWSGIPYVIDFRDLWSTTRYLPFDSPIARRYFGMLERQISCRAKALITVNAFIKNYLEELCPHVPTHELLNGYDGRLDWDTARFNTVEGTDKSLLYSGSIAVYHGMDAFLKAAAPALNSPNGPRLRFMGRDYLGALDGVNVEKMPHGTSAEAEKIGGRAGVLLLTLGRDATEFTTAKLFSYIKLGRPILYFGPTNSPAARMIAHHRIGWVVDCDAPNALPPVLNDIGMRFKAGKSFDFAPDFEGLKSYSIEAVGAKLDECLAQAADAAK